MVSHRNRMLELASGNREVTVVVMEQILALARLSVGLRVLGLVALGSRLQLRQSDRAAGAGLARGITVHIALRMPFLSLELLSLE